MIPVVSKFEMSVMIRTVFSIPSFKALVLGSALLIGGALTNAALATETDLGTHKDWTAVKVSENGQTYCYMISAPQDTNPKGVRRGAINFFVSKVPSTKATEINVQMGYPLAEKSSGSSLSARIGSTDIGFTTQHQDGWAPAGKVNSLISAMKKGSKMTVKGKSRRGTNTTDVYSLSGFTAAYNAISKACNM